MNILGYTAPNSVTALLALAVTAPANTPAYTFDATTLSLNPGAIGYAVLVANGISNAPTVSGMTQDAASLSWTNTAGIPNYITFYSDDVTGVVYYLIAGAGAAIPTPTAFSAVRNQQQITITYSGATLAAGSPSPQFFSLSVSRPGSKQPYTVASINAVTAGASTVTLNTTAPILLTDGVLVSYQPSGPTALSDQTGPPPNTLPPFANAAILIS